uniref:Uncharacterized protein n=1 Tax=Oryza barthii TaxID=65489 RepID=A0A679BCS1_9ORYZ|nr:hypothetical protein [Oryza barthii]
MERRRRPHNRPNTRGVGGHAEAAEVVPPHPESGDGGGSEGVAGEWSNVGTAMRGGGRRGRGKSAQALDLGDDGSREREGGESESNTEMRPSLLRSASQAFRRSHRRDYSSTSAAATGRNVAILGAVRMTMAAP